MSRSRPNRKAPDIDILARSYLAQGLKQHPDISKHVDNVEAVNDMGMWALLNLAKTMGVDANEMIRKVEDEGRARSDYSFKYPAFKGELPFDLTFSFLGKTVTRKAKLVYEHTPEWPYFDLLKQAVNEGWNGTSYHIELAAEPEEYGSDDTPIPMKPEWFQSEDIARDGVLPREEWDALLDLVDEQCKVEDAERRRGAKARRAAMNPRSKRRH